MKSSPAKKRRSCGVRYTLAEVREALTKTSGLVDPAARLLGCDRNTVKRWIQKAPALAQIRDEGREELLDAAEDQLRVKVLAGDAWAVCFTLKCLGKDRGYTERLENTGRGGGPMQLEAMTLDDDQRLARIAALLDRARVRQGRQAGKGGGNGID